MSGPVRLVHAREELFGLLTEAAIEAERAALLDAFDELYLRDGGGLHLSLGVASIASRWRVVTPSLGRRTTAIIGSYPDLSIAEARAIARSMRTTI